MIQLFGPARPPGRRNKILICGKSGTGKSLSAMGFPMCAYIDNHGSVENYQTAYPDHLYFPKEGQVATVDLTTDAVKRLLIDPGDRLTVVIDDITTYNNQVDFKWNNLFLKRQVGGKGHHLEYYSNQPNDYIHPKREKNAFIRRLLAMDLNVIIIARMKTQYAGATGGTDFMKVIGETFAGDENLVYEFDYLFKFVQDDDGKRYAEIMGKQRVPAGGKLFPARSEFEITPAGKSTFYEVFCQYAVVQRFKTAAHAVIDPVTETTLREAPPAPAGEELPTIQPGKVIAAGDVDKTLAAKVSAAVTVGAETQHPAEIAPPAGTPVEITTKQLDDLVELKGKFLIQKPEWDKELAKYNVTSARDLTHDQANDFIKYLENDRVPF